jgi:hypothetical protein
MSKKFNVKDIVNERKNELDYSPLFQSKTKPDTVVKTKSPEILPVTEEHKQQHNASIPDSQKAGMPANQKDGKPESQNASIPAIQHAGKTKPKADITATEKVTYRFHPAGKYAVQDIKTILTRKYGIKASLEEIAEECILMAYEDLLENQNASKLANRFSRIPANQNSS